MEKLSNHPYFTEWTDPSSGVKSFVLTKKASPLQQSFYFTNSSLSADEKYLWFYATYPPAPVTTRTLGVVSMDPDAPFIQVFPETAFWDASPLVTPEGDSVYFFQGKGVSKFSIGGKVEKVCELDSDYIGGRHLFRGSTHLTLSADGKQLLIDGQVGNRWFVSVGDLETGKIEIINEFPRMYNHAQFSPANPKLFSMAQDWWFDPITGQKGDIDQRIWVMDTQRTLCYPIAPKEWVGHGKNNPSHEWWSKDGKLCWTDYKQGAFQFDVETEEKVHIWKRPLCHTHCDSTRRYWCADQSPYRWDSEPCKVLFYDYETGKETLIAALPQPAWSRKAYHIDPHPQFSPSDRYIVYTTTVGEGVTLALCPTSQLKEQ